MMNGGTMNPFTRTPNSTGPALLTRPIFVGSSDRPLTAPFTSDDKNNKPKTDTDKKEEQPTVVPVYPATDNGILFRRLHYKISEFKYGALTLDRHLLNYALLCDRSFYAKIELDVLAKLRYAIWIFDVLPGCDAIVIDMYHTMPFVNDYKDGTFDEEMRNFKIVFAHDTPDEVPPLALRWYKNELRFGVL